MTALPDFRLEAYFSRFEFKARFHMAASNAQSLELGELLAMADPAEAEAFHKTWLGYTETFGAPALRARIAATYANCSADDIICFAGAQEGIYVASHALLDADSHAIVVTPNYQSLETIPLSICAVSGMALDPAQGWDLDIERLAAAIRPNTRLVSINFPHNPSGRIIARDTLEQLVALCRRHGLWLFSDEVYRLLGAEPARHLPQVADIYERGLSLNVMSKAYGLPGLRIGWIACQDHGLRRRMERLKHYLSICNAAPSEALACIALTHRAAILARNNALVRDNLERLEAFFAEFDERFEWQRPDGGCVAYPRYLGPGTVEDFTGRLIERSGILLLPSTLYVSELGPTPDDRFRIGFGRADFAAGLAAFGAYLRASS